MPSVIDRAARTLRALDGVDFNATDDTITVPPAADDGFLVRLRMVHDREFVVWFDRWEHDLRSRRGRAMTASSTGCRTVAA